VTEFIKEYNARSIIESICIIIKNQVKIGSSIHICVWLGNVCSI